jgi:anti-sigma28 factor (negative regulator of flagellin synthesis)
MRLQLDTGNTTQAPETANGGSGVGSTANINGNYQTYKGGIGAGSSLNGDSVAFSGASQAWSASFSDRAARIGQLTAAVQNGSYQVSSAAIGQSIVASATT